MNSNMAIGIFMLVTSVVVLVPVVLQWREGKFRLREIWGLFVLIAGFAVVGAGYAFFEGGMRQRLSFIGLAGVICGLLAQHTRRDNTPRERDAGTHVENR
jgi:hypothetical protein